MSRYMKQTPNDSPGDGTINQIAQEQLRYWQNVADEWGIYFDNVSANRCMLCDQCIWFRFDPHGEEYNYTDAEISALIVAHVRQVHDG